MSKLGFVVDYNELYESLMVFIDGQEYQNELLTDNKHLHLYIKIKSKIYDNKPTTVFQTLILLMNQKAEWFLPYTFNYKCEVALNDEGIIQIPIKVNLRNKSVTFDQKQIDAGEICVTNSISNTSISNENLKKYKNTIIAEILLLSFILLFLCTVFLVFGGVYTVLIPIAVLVPPFIAIICIFKRQYSNYKDIQRE